MYKSRRGRSVRWERTLGDGTMDCRVERSADGTVMHYRFAFRGKDWGPLDHIRFDHDPSGREPHHLDMKLGTREIDENEVERLLPSVLARWREIKEVVA